MTERASVARVLRHCAALGCLLGGTLATPRALAAQHQNYGAPFLLLPVGAHAVGQSEAVVADSSLGTEAIWWNPSALARLPKREIAIHHSQTFAATSDMVAAALPSRILGTLAAAVYIVNYGDDQEATDSTGGFLGSISNKNILFAVSYATPITKRLSAGITAKQIILRFVCVGCNVSTPKLEGSTGAIDMGAQYALPTPVPITLGASLRNLGPPLQVKDAEQADPLPRIVQLGARARVPVAALARTGSTLDVMSDVSLSPALGAPAVAVGATLTYRDDYMLRGGYKSTNGGNLGGFGVGAAVRLGRAEINLARRFDSTSDLGTPPVYVSLRFLF